MSKVILFDCECIFCNYWVNFVIKYDTSDKFIFASLQSNYAKKKLEKFNISNLASDTFILIDGNNYYTKSDAAFLVLQNLQHWSRNFIFLKLIPKAVRDYFYDFIAKHRKKLFNNKSYCIIASEKLKKKFIE